LYNKALRKNSIPPGNLFVEPSFNVLIACPKMGSPLIRTASSSTIPLLTTIESGSGPFGKLVGGLRPLFGKMHPPQNPRLTIKQSTILGERHIPFEKDLVGAMLSCAKPLAF